ncbi:hypothetical protein DFJ74DRAFT_740392, partial [Hyaloraphidium curvatum]
GQAAQRRGQRRRLREHGEELLRREHRVGLFGVFHRAWVPAGDSGIFLRRFSALQLSPHQLSTAMRGGGTEGSAADILGAEEWLALLPSATFPGKGVSTSEPHEFMESDPAADARSEMPLTRADYDAAFAASLPHRATLLLQRRLPHTNAHLWPRMAYYTVPHLVLAFASIGDMLSSGMFDERGVGVGLAALAIAHLFHAFLLPPMVQAALAVQADLDRHPFAPYVRWTRLARLAQGRPAPTELGAAELAGIADGSGGVSLMAHDADDPLCPCPAPSCGGSAVGTSAVYQSVLFVYGILPGLVSWTVLAQWTFLVTLASETWTSWKAFFAVWTILANLAVWVSFEVSSTDVALIRLESKLKHRALKDALAAFVDRCCNATLAESADNEAAAPICWPSPEPYITLHLAFAPSWRANKGITEAVTSLFLGLFLGMAVLSLVLLIGSGCIPAYILAAAAIYLVSLVRHLADAVAANSGVSAVANLYRRARTSLAALQTAHPSHAELPRLLAHEKLLARYEAAVQEDLARVFGLVVDFGLLRGLLVTGLTVGVGLFGILRGAGARATVQTVCPVY